MIRYKGIEFDNASELVAYQKAIKEIKEPEPEPKKEEVTLPITSEVAIKSPMKYRFTQRNTIWTKQDDEFLKEECALLSGRKMSYKKLVEISRYLSRTIIAVKVRISIKGYNKVKKEKEPEPEPEPRKAETMIKKKPLVPVPYETQMTNMANKYVYPKNDKPEDYMPEDFPMIEPIMEQSLPVLESMVLNMIANRGSLSMFDFTNSIALKPGHEWRGGTWRFFCENFAEKIPDIARALNVDAKGFKVKQNEKGFHYIYYEG